MSGAAPVRLYDLAGVRDEFRISPFCWRIRMAIAHKRLPVEIIPWRMIEKDKIVSANSITVPVVVDGTSVVADSWAIAEYLDRAHPEHPLFDSAQARAYCLWIHHWTERIVHPLIVPLILEDVLRVLHPKDIDYFRKTREKAYRKSLEAVFDRSPEAFGRLAAALGPVRRVLRQSEFLAGDSPAYGDYIVFGAFQWARCCSAVELLSDRNDPMLLWFDRMLNLHGGIGREAARAGGNSESSTLNQKRSP